MTLNPSNLPGAVGGSSNGGIATLQTSAQNNNAAGQINANFQMPQAGNVQLPSWLSASPDDHMHELLQSYAGVGAAFDPSGQVQARNNAIGYNTTAGTQAANNAASEYANRASQQGGSALGAGVVKAQAMLPVFAQNAALKSDAADVAAKAHQDAATLASQIGDTIGKLRMSYLGTLAGFVQNQQGMALDTFKANQAVAGNAADRQQSAAQFAYTASQQPQKQQAAASSPAAKPSDFSITPTSFVNNNYLTGFAPSQMAANQQLRGML